MQLLLLVPLVLLVQLLPGPAAAMPRVPAGPVITGVPADFLDGFGKAVAVARNGTVALVGAPGDSFDGHGNAWVYSRASGEASWSRVASLNESLDLYPGSAFGTAVALNLLGTTALVGAVDDGPRGKAYVFSSGGGGPRAWRVEGVLAPPPPSPGNSYFFGSAVALSADGRVALVGAPFEINDKYPQEYGAAYVFARGDGGWSPVQRLGSPASKPGPACGGALSLSASGRVALVGCSALLGSGVVHVWEAGAGAGPSPWSVVATLAPSEGADAVDDGFGGGALSLSASGRVALVGASSAPDPERGLVAVGAVYAFAAGAGGADGWRLADKMVPPAEERGNHTAFGNTAAVDGDGRRAVVAAYNRGAPHVYLSGAGGRWKRAAELAPPGEKAVISCALSLDGSTALLGTPGSGSVTSYSLGPEP